MITQCLSLVLAACAFPQGDNSQPDVSAEILVPATSVAFEPLTFVVVVRNSGRAVRRVEVSPMEEYESLVQTGNGLSWQAVRINYGPDAPYVRSSEGISTGLDGEPVPSGGEVAFVREIVAIPIVSAIGRYRVRVAVSVFDDGVGGRQHPLKGICSPWSAFEVVESQENRRILDVARGNNDRLWAAYRSILFGELFMDGAGTLSGISLNATQLQAFTGGIVTNDELVLNSGLSLRLVARAKLCQVTSRVIRAKDLEGAARATALAEASTILADVEHMNLGDGGKRMTLTSACMRTIIYGKMGEWAAAEATVDGCRSIVANNVSGDLDVVRNWVSGRGIVRRTRK